MVPIILALPLVYWLPSRLIDVSRNKWKKSPLVFANVQDISLFRLTQEESFVKISCPLSEDGTERPSMVYSCGYAHALYHVQECGGQVAAAEAREAVYTIASGTVVMTGNVILTQGQNALSSDKLTVTVRQANCDREVYLSSAMRPQIRHSSVWRLQSDRREQVDPPDRLEPTRILLEAKILDFGTTPTVYKFLPHLKSIRQSD